MAIILDKKYFKCPFCGSDEIEIEVDWEIPHRQYEGVDLRIEFDCPDCNKNTNLKEFDKILKQR